MTVTGSPRSAWRRSVVVVGVALLGWVGRAPPLTAQRTGDAVLILPPLPEQRDADSTFAMDLAAELRDRVHQHRRILTSLSLCRETSLCERFIGANGVADYGKLAYADFVVVGRMPRRSGPRVHYDIFDTGQRGGVQHRVLTVTLDGPDGVAPRDLAKSLGGVLRDTLRVASRAAERVRRCWAAVRDGQPQRGRREAERAMQDIRDHSGAALCLSHVFAARSASADSTIWALEKAVAGDSLLTDAWEGLGRAYLEVGDTVRAARARFHEVRADPTDTDRRLRVARLLDQLGQHQLAVDLVREGVGAGGNDAELRQLLPRLCVQYEMWSCALDALVERATVDSSVASDTTFYFQVIGLAQRLADTTAMVRWSREAVGRMEGWVSAAWERAAEARRSAERSEEVLAALLMAHAAAVADVGRRDSALAVYRRIWEADSTNFRAPIAAAQLLTAPRFLPLDTGIAIDTAALALADSLLEMAAARAENDRVRQGISVTYLNVGMRLVQARAVPANAIRWLDGALRHDADSTLHRRSRALRGLAVFYLLEEVDTRVRVEQTCELVDEEASLVEQGRSDLRTGQQEFPEVAQQLLAGLELYDTAVVDLRAALRC